MRFRNGFGVVAAATVCIGAAEAAPVKFSDLYVFGDSLADVGIAFSVTGGQIPPTPPYFMGQFTGPDGPVWAELVGDAFEAQGKETRNYAIGGARALGNGPTDLPAQVGRFAVDVAAGSVEPGPESVAAWWFGANDIFIDPSAATAAADAVAAAAAGLSIFGIEDFLFFTYSDFSLLPAFAGTPAAAAVQAASQAFNARLAGNVATLEQLGFDPILVDTASLFADATADPAAFGFTNVTDACVIRDDASVLVDCTIIPGVDADGFLWFDQVHPSSRAHAKIADAVLAEIAPIPLPATLPLAMLGFAAIGIASRRRKA